MAENFVFQTLEFWGWRSRIDVGWGSRKLAKWPYLDWKVFFFPLRRRPTHFYSSGKKLVCCSGGGEKSFFPRVPVQEGGSSGRRDSFSTLGRSFLLRLQPPSPGN